MSEDAEDAGPLPRRAFWTGSIRIGLVNIPVRVMVMVREHTVPFHLLHREDGQPIEYRRVCQRDNREVPCEEIVKGYEVRDGEYIVIEKEEIEAVRPESDRKIRIDRFINVLSIDPVYYDRSYILVPDGTPEAYSLMTEVFRKKGRAGVGKITLRTREYPALVREYQDALLLKHGVEHLSDAQLLAIILRTGGDGKSALDLAVEILTGLEDLRGIENASRGEFTRFKGMGNAKVAQLKAAFELARRMIEEPAKRGPAFTSSHDVYAYYQQRLRELKKEVFYCAMLDAKNRISKDFCVSEGTLTNSLIHPREAFKNAIKESAASVIFVHNHPSGDPHPSREDIIVTERLTNAGEIVGIKVLDHVIIGDNKYTSMMEEGYIKNNNQ